MTSAVTFQKERKNRRRPRIARKKHLLRRRAKRHRQRASASWGPSQIFLWVRTSPARRAKPIEELKLTKSFRRSLQNLAMNFQPLTRELRLMSKRERQAMKPTTNWIWLISSRARNILKVRTTKRFLKRINFKMRSSWSMPSRMLYREKKAKNPKPNNLKTCWSTWPITASKWPKITTRSTI